MLYPQNVLSIQYKIYKNAWGLILLTYSFTVHYHKTSFFQIQVHGSDYTSLYEHIPRKFLPTEYGGDAGSIPEHWGVIHKDFFSSFNLYCDNCNQCLNTWNAVQGNSFKNGVGRTLSSTDSICDHLNLDLSNCHTRIFGNLSVRKGTRKLKHSLWDALTL